MLEVSIKDNGVGISQSNLKRLFQYDGFIRSQRKQESGIGLGLYICRKIVRALGGEIICESQLGIDCTFKFVVKCFEPNSLEQQVSRTLNPIPRRNFVRVSIQEQLNDQAVVEVGSEGDIENSQAPLRLFQIEP